MSIERVEPGVYSVLQDGRQIELRISQDGDSYRVTVLGRSHSFMLEDPRRWSDSAASASGQSSARVLSPMPGKVVRALVAAGDSVHAGQGLVVVEAMKMQNELKSPIDGIVTKVSVEAGATVNANQVLVIVEAHGA
jgi:biotin carboxyl carrier protein